MNERSLKIKKRNQVCRQILFLHCGTYILSGQVEMYLALLSLCSHCHCRRHAPPQGRMSQSYNAKAADSQVLDHLHYQVWTRKNIQISNK